MPYSRDVHTHFTSANAEESYMKQYLIDPSPVNCERVLNPNAGVLRVSLKDFPIPAEISYAIVLDDSNGEFYYYYVTGFNVLSSGVVELFTEVDEYHTYFNSRGGNVAFIGCLLQSNTTFMTPLFPNPDSYTKTGEIDFFSNQTFTLLIYCNLSKTGLKSLSIEEKFGTLDAAMNAVNKILQSTELKRVEGSTTTTENFTPISVYIIPSDLRSVSKSVKWTTDTYTNPLYEAIGNQVSKVYNPELRVNNYFGTPFKKIKFISKDFKTVMLRAQLFTTNGTPSLYISANDSNLIDVIDDFECASVYNEIGQYLSQTKMSRALNALSSVVGIGSGIMQSSPSQAIGGVFGLARQAVSETEMLNKEDRIVNSSGGVYATIGFSSGYAGITVQYYQAEDNVYYAAQYLRYGGDCYETLENFTSLIKYDSQKQSDMTYPFYYRFSIIVKCENKFQRVENMFKDGIFIRYVNE